jgi:hypothetical protein
MIIARAPLCVSCHSVVETESPAIGKLAAAAKDNKPIPGGPIHEIPSNVNFPPLRAP